MNRRRASGATSPVSAGSGLLVSPRGHSDRRDGTGRTPPHVPHCKRSLDRRPGPALLAETPEVVLTAPGHSPTAGERWGSTVRVSEGGGPVAATVTAEVVDPVGGVHPLPFGRATTKDISDRRFTRTFRDFIRWPAESRGVPLTCKPTIEVGSATGVERYNVTLVG